MSQYVSGVAAFTADNFIVDGDDECPRHMLLPGCFDGFDFTESSVAILTNHDWNERLGCTDDNAKLWMDGNRLRFTCLLKNTSVADRFREGHQRARVLGCSIRCSGNFETRYDRAGNPYKAISRVFHISDVGPVSTARNPFCHGLTVSDRPAFEAAKPVAQVSAVTNSAGKRRKPLMIVPPMPESMLNGMAIAEAAKLGGGCMVKGVRLSAESVQNLIRSRQHAVR